MRLACLILASVSFAFASHAQDQFRAFASTVDMIEGGRVDTMVVVTGTERLTTRIPRGYAARVDVFEKSVIFTDKTNGAIAITLQVTTNSPGVMPDEDTMRDKALAANPGGSFLQLASCSTGYQPARFVDTFRRIAEGLSIKTRHAFIACPEGTVEFVLRANGEGFDQGRQVFNLLMSSFRMEQVKKPEPPPAP
jgi:hypothetical protein